MDLAVQWSLIVLAASGVVAAVSLVVCLRKLLPVLERSRVVLAQTRRTLMRIDRIADDLEAAARDARRIEGRLSDLTGQLLENFEGPLKLVSALVSGANAGLASLLRSAASRSRNGAGHEGHERREVHRRSNQTAGGGDIHG